MCTVFFLGGGMKIEYDKVVDEYCWPVTQAVGWSCCGQSGATVLECGFQLDFFVYTYVVSDMCAEVQLGEIWLAPYPPEFNYAWGGECVFNVPIFSITAMLLGLLGPWTLRLLQIKSDCLSISMASYPVRCESPFVVTLRTVSFVIRNWESGVTGWHRTLECQVFPSSGPYNPWISVLLCQCNLTDWLIISEPFLIKMTW